jgi:hypothetical protein
MWYVIMRFCAGADVRDFEHGTKRGHNRLKTLRRAGKMKLSKRAAETPELLSPQTWTRLGLLSSSDGL